MKSKGIFLLLFVLPLLSCSSGSSDGGGQVVLARSRLGSAGGFIDINGDGLPDLVLGAPEASGSPKTGAVLAFLNSSQGFADTPAWKMKGEGEGCCMGFSYATLGDVDGDEKADFAVSALFACGEAPLSGVVYVFKGGARAPTQLARLSGKAPLDKFGYWVTGADLNGDGFSDIVVSAIHATGLAFQSGAVYVYFGGRQIAGSPDAVIRGDAPNHSIGVALAAGDINGDLVSDLMIGCGDAVHVYYGGVDFGGRIAAGHLPDVVINGQAAQGGSHSGSGFGNALAFLGDMDGDGIGDFAVANPNRTEPLTYDNRGSVYLFRGGRDLPAEIFESDTGYRLAKIVGAADSDRFGSAIALIEDIDGGGKRDLLISAPWAEGGATRPMAVAGKVYLFHTETLLDGSAAVYDPTYAGRVLTADTPSGELGKTIAVASNGTVFIGAPLAKQTDGGAFLFHMDSGALNEIGVSTVY